MDRVLGGVIIIPGLLTDANGAMERPLLLTDPVRRAAELGRVPV